MMNREQRRINGIVKKPVTITFTQERLEKEIEKELTERLKTERAKAMKTTINAFMATMIISLNDLNGFGKKRLQRLIDKIQLQFDCIQADTVDLGDLIKEAERWIKIESEVTFGNGGGI